MADHSFTLILAKINNSKAKKVVTYYSNIKVSLSNKVPIVFTLPAHVAEEDSCFVLRLR